MAIDLRQCSKECTLCIKNYIKKYQLKKGDNFKVPCQGIPKEYVPDSVVASIGGDKEAAVSIFDPVTWAALNLDWHCIDPDGEIWKRKTLNMSLGELPKYQKEQALSGKSIFHRPYQAEMLRCTARRKVFRIGRQAGKTETLCVAMLHQLYTHEDFKIVVIAPYQSQIDLIFARLVSFIKKNPALTNSVRRKVKAPQYAIQLHNGSQVLGFTAGTKSGGNADAARGQSANMLVFDEADYLSSGDMDSALAIITNFPDATVWMSSTPTGRREKFYETCHNKVFREFHYPSHVNPNWTEELDELYRTQLTEDGYRHEVLGEFGEQEEGVYQVRYVEAAQMDYEYSDMKPTKGWTYMIGCDWNDPKIGTSIAVVGFNPHAGKFYLCDKRTISRGQRTQLSACEKIAELNRIWHPDAIYVDRGYGTTQIEILKDFGHRSMQQYGAGHTDARLMHIVKGYDFGGSIETYDLITKQPMKKHAKPFLVENSVRRFETGTFHYPKSDKHYTEQLLGYIIDRVTDTGRFIYKAQNETVGDHFLDAVNLAFVAFTLEKTKLGKRSFDSSITFANNLRSFGTESEESIPKFLSNADQHRPKEGRGDLGRRAQKVVSSLSDIPAANTSPDVRGVKLWSWPGWSHDAPKPRPKLFSRGSSSSRRHRIRPQRKKF